MTRASHALLRTILALLALALPGAAAGQGGASVSGRVLSPSGSPVAGAAVVLSARDRSGARRTASTDSAGAFRFSAVPAGRHRLRATRIGYDPAERELTLRAGAEERVELRLAERSVAVEGVVVQGRRDERERARFETEAGVTTRVIGGEELKILPGLGEADVMRAVEVLPGVVSTSDFSSAFNVRGGSADQNLILLDGFPIFNPFHLGGLFSVFNSDAIARAELMAGGFGAEHGGRVSSVLTVETRPGEGRFTAEGGISLLASRVSLHGDLPGGLARAVGGEGASFLVSGRRSYFDAVLASVADFPYHLTDLQAGVTVGTRGGGRLRFTGYTGRDVLDLSEFQPPEDDDPETDEDNVLRIRWNWGNDVAGLRWEQPFGRWVADARVGHSRYREDLGFVDFEDARFRSAISETALRASAGRPLSARTEVKLGGEVARTRFDNSGEAGGTRFYGNRGGGTLSAAYGQLRWRPSSAWILEPGLRADVWTSGGSTRTVLSPRLAAKRFLGSAREAAVKLSVGRYAQFVHSIRDEALPVSNDTWVTAGRHVPHVVSDQVQVGIEKFWGERWYASAETYGRRFRGLTDFNFAEDPNDESDDLLEGEGTSYGADFLVRRSAGRVSGWATVSLLKATRTFPDPTAAGWDSVPTFTFPPGFDRRVDVDLVLEARAPGSTRVGARWNFGSGVPYSRPVAAFAGWETDLANGGFRFPRPRGDDPEVPTYIVPGRRNAERYPAYHRLDMTVRRTFTRRWGKLTPYLQVLNVYNRRNVLFYFFQYEDQPATRAGMSMFPVLPAIGVEGVF